MRRSGRALAVLIALAAVLSACAGLPTSGPVNPGLQSDEVPEDNFLYYPEGPASGATPEQIVQGFVEAATSPAGDWATAREFLTEDFADAWEPGSFVVIDVPNGRTYDDTLLATEQAVVLRTSTVATVDQRGVYATASDPGEELRYELEQRADGEWRIAQAPEGIVLDRDYFPNVYSDYTLHFYDPTGRFLVPDVRWFPEAAMRPTRLAAELLRGPSASLQGAVRTAFPEGSQLAEGTVVAIDESGIADVALQGVATGVDAGVIARMRAQLTATLAGVGAQGVRLRAGSSELSAEEQDPLPTRPDTRALVLGGEDLGGAFGFLATDGIERIDGLSDAIESMSPAPRSISVSRERDAALVQGADGAVSLVTAAGEVLTLDERAGLIEPALDPSGYTWSVPQSAPGQLAAIGADGEVVLSTGLPQNDALAITSVQAIAVSRDGTRFAALVTGAGGESWAVVAPIIRDGEGEPSGVGEVGVLTQLDGAGVDVEWLDDAGVGIVARDGAELEIVDQRIGGPGTRMASPADAVGIASGTQGSPIRLLDADGGLHVRRGAAWVRTVLGVAVLATDVGAPQED